MLALFLGVLLQLAPAVVFDALVHDFGPHPVSDKELGYTFEFKNVSGNNVSIAYALATCPCSTVTWTRESVAPGGKGKVSVIYEKELYADQFDKNISVFFEGESKPVMLRIRGSFYDTSETLADDFPAQRGDLGFDSDSFDLKELIQGVEFRGRFFVANMGEKPIDVRL